MIIKERTIPLKLQKLEALLRRIPGNHAKKQQIEEDYRKNLAGYRGEQSLDYHLSFLPEEDYLILHDLRLQVEKHFVQIDILILHQGYVLIIEVKNLAGTLYFDQQFNQLIRTNNEIEEGFADPIMQVRKQKFLLHKWLTKNKVTNLPIKTLIVISNPSTIIKSSSKISQVMHAANLPAKIITFESKTENLSAKELRKLARLLKKSHQPHQTDILNKYQVQETEIQKGVQCPNCNTFPMVRIRGKWFCNACCHKAADAHLAALKDYYLLISQTITNQKLRNFLLLPSASIAAKILASMNLTSSGTTKNKQHNLPGTTL